MIIKSDLTSVFFMVMFSTCFFFSIKKSWVNGTAVSEENQKLEDKKTTPSKYGNQAVAQIKVYTEIDRRASKPISKKFTGFGKQSVGVWKPKSGSPHGIEFLFCIAIDYFRCDGQRTAMVTTKEELDELDYVVTPWNVIDLPSWGWTLIAEADYVNVYQNPKKK